MGVTIRAPYWYTFVEFSIAVATYLGKARALQGYADEYTVHYPGMEFMADEHGPGRGLRLSALHEWTKSKGAVFGAAGYWERPLHYGDPDTEYSWKHGQTSYSQSVETEHHACRDGCVLLDMSSFGKLAVAGSDATALLEWCTSSLIADMAYGDSSPVHYTQMLNARGGVEADVTVVRTGPSSYYLVTGAGSACHDADHLLEQARGEGFADVNIKDTSDTMAVLAVAGPTSREVLGNVCAGGVDVLSNELFPYGTARQLKITVVGDDNAGRTAQKKEVSVLALRVSFVGELGWELHCPAGDAVAVAQALHGTEASPPPSPVTLGGYRSILDSLRVEKQFLHWGHDVGPEDSPLEAGLGFVSARKLKGDVEFLGRDVLEQQKKDGISKRLMSFKVVGNEDDVDSLYGNEVVWVDGEQVGKLTTGGVGYSVNSGNAIGMGFVRKTEDDAAEKGTPTYWRRKVADAVEGKAVWEVEVAGQRLRVMPSLSALYDPKGTKMRV